MGVNSKPQDSLTLKLVLCDHVVSKKIDYPIRADIVVRVRDNNGNKDTRYNGSKGKEARHTESDQLQIGRQQLRSKKNNNNNEVCFSR